MGMHTETKQERE